MVVMKFTNLTHIFNQKSLISDVNLSQQEINALRKYIPAMFPTKNMNLTKSEVDLAQDINDNIIRNLEYNESRPTNIYNEDYLPFHTRDNAWLAKYLNTVIKEMANEEKKLERIVKKFDHQVYHDHFMDKSANKTQDKVVVLVDQSKDTQIKMAHIQRFVETDLFFAQARNAYEEDLVRAQIQFMMHSKTPNGILLSRKYDPVTNTSTISPDYDPFLARQQRNADKLFRQGVISAMHQLGVSRRSTEYALEKYADLWLEETMTDAFYNKYKLVPHRKETFNDEISWYSINIQRENVKDAWLSLRKNKYYQEHKEIIDELGLATPNMKMSEEDLQNLKEEINLWKLYYQAYVRQDSKTIDPTDNEDLTQI